MEDRRERALQRRRERYRERRGDETTPERERKLQSERERRRRRLLGESPEAKEGRLERRRRQRAAAFSLRREVTLDQNAHVNLIIPFMHACVHTHMHTNF